MFKSSKFLYIDVHILFELCKSIRIILINMQILFILDDKRTMKTIIYCLVLGVGIYMNPIKKHNDFLGEKVARQTSNIWFFSFFFNYFFKTLFFV